ncbi:MAGE family-domain-containing protein [Roridomyces roridus]|uniref:MAGE family-domain-containing protein n=1 Tax=Roridomyces roridus TaxID=1738132 RepID=A0AAD7FFG5_9AGAR|nr:MAGE family-domain-containing protein [Roridomyces roridus]
MARATTRSQRPSQSQKRRAQDSEEEDDDEGRNMDVDDDEDGEEQDSRKELSRAANALVRLAMFTEHKRVPLRRDEISKKALGSNTRTFMRVFAAAQEILRDTLGMELVELRSRAELDKEQTNTNANNDDLENARKATGVKQKSAAAGSKTYILRSVLHDQLIAQAALTDETILEEEAADAPSDDDDDEFGFRNAPAGSIISWTNADQIGPLGVLYVVLALILVSGRVIGDPDLRGMLKRLRLPATGTITFSPASTHRTLTLDAYLTLLLRQNYLDRQQVGGDAAKKGKGAKRGRVTQADDEGGQTYEWRWGARAQSEVGEKAIAEFVAEFMVGEREEAEEDQEEGGRRRGTKQRADAESKFDKMFKGIERAAGGQLADIM